MYKKKILTIIAFFYSLHFVFAQSGNMPLWVQTPPQNTITEVFFVGKSERANNYDNILEAKTGALIDVLIQFSIYKGIDINYMENNYISGSIENTNLKGEFESAARLFFDIDSVGLYQKDEWIAADGMLYVLYGYCIENQLNKYSLPNTLASGDFITNIFPDFRSEGNRIYFYSLSFSKKNNSNELALLAEQNAKTQVFLWLGTNTRGLIDNYIKNTEQTGKTKKEETLETIISSKSNIDLKSVYFREEARNIQRGKDGKFYFYGLYSIINTSPNNTTENELFTYYVKQNNESFVKNITIHENTFKKNKFNFNKQSNVLQSRRSNQEIYNSNNISNTDSYISIGMDKNNSIEIQNIKATITALISIALKIDSNVKAMISEYDAENNKNESPRILDVIENLSSRTSSTKISRCIKIREEISTDGTLFQFWRLSKNDTKEVNKR